MSVVINGSNTPTAGGVTYGDGTQYATTAAGTSGQLLQSNGSSAPSWVTFAAGTSITRTTKTANYTLAAADKGNLVVATSGTFTFAFTAAATLGAGWCVYLQNSGTGNITLDPNGSETIDGLTSYIMYPGEVRLVQCDGTGFNSVVLNGFYTTFTTTSTFTKPPGYTQIAGLLWGAGGGGGKSTDTGGIAYYIGGGGGGACAPFTMAASSVSSSVTVTIGSGGAGATNYEVAGGIGGTTSFGSYARAYGGGGGMGNYGANRGAGGGGGVLSAGASATGGGYNGGAGGMPSFFISSQTAHNPGFGGGAGADYNGGAANAAYGGAGGGTTQAGGSSFYGGGGGGGAVATSVANAGGTSYFGGAGGAASLAGTAGTGSARGGGGGATVTGTAGTGGLGEAQIWGIV